MNRTLPPRSSRRHRHPVHPRLSPAPRQVEAALVRVCADCEQEFGPVPVPPGRLKTHGFCRRHALDCLRTGGLPEQAIRDFERRWRTVEMAPDRSLTAGPDPFGFSFAAGESVAVADTPAIDVRPG